MSSGDVIAILIAFVAYLAVMVIIGAIYMKNTNDSEDYFLGGRGKRFKRTYQLFCNKKC